MSTARLIQIAWMLPALTVLGICARTAILDLLDRQDSPADERSWT